MKRNSCSIWILWRHSLTGFILAFFDAKCNRQRRNDQKFNIYYLKFNRLHQEEKKKEIVQISKKNEVPRINVITLTIVYTDFQITIF